MCIEKNSILVASIFIILMVTSCATTSTISKPNENRKSIEKQWGIKIEGLRLTAAGYMVDFRYRILDPEKALPLVDRTIKPYLTDRKTGKTLAVPNTAKIGPLRSTVRYGKPKKGRVYFILFGNNGKYIKQGSRVTIVIGDFKTDLTVE